MNPHDLLYIGSAVVGSSVAALAFMAAQKGRWKDRHARDALVSDEILGHRGIPGVPDKLPLSQRLFNVEVGVTGMQRELHPNGGASMADAVLETRRLAQGIADRTASRDRQVAEIRMLVERLEERGSKLAHRLANDAQAKDLQEHIVRAYIEANPETFPELYHIMRSFPPVTPTPPS